MGMTQDAADSGASFPFWQVYRVPIIMGVLSLLFVALSITIFIKSYQDATPIRFSSDTAEASTSADKALSETAILVDIEGAVAAPGLYRLPAGSRVQELLDLAGGFTDSADQVFISKTINRAAKLTDGAKLYVPFIGEDVRSGGGENQESAGVNINTATAQELESLPGVGEVIAGKIIAGRPYLRLEELVEKNAVSQSLFEKIKDQLVF